MGEASFFRGAGFIIREGYYNLPNESPRIMHPQHSLCLSPCPHVPLPPQWCSPCPRVTLPACPLNLCPLACIARVPSPTCQLANSPPELVPMSPQLEVANCDFKFSTHPLPKLVSPRHPHPKRGQTTTTGSDYLKRVRLP